MKIEIFTALRDQEGKLVDAKDDPAKLTVLLDGVDVSEKIRVEVIPKAKLIEEKKLDPALKYDAEHSKDAPAVDTKEAGALMEFFGAFCWDIPNPEAFFAGKQVLTGETDSVVVRVSPWQ